MSYLMVEPTQTQQLVARAKAGDREAFDEIAKQYDERLRDGVTRQLSTREGVDVEEVVQETFVRAFEAIDRFEWRGSDSVYPWLFGIARNVVRKLHENSVKARPLEIPDRLPARDVSPSRELRREERFDRLESSFAKLKPEYHEVLRLARIEGLKIKEVALRMGRSEYSVKHLIARAMEQLRESMSDTRSLGLPPRALDGQEDQDGTE